MDEADEESAARLRYAYKPSLMGAAWSFELAPDALVWAMGAISGRVPYARIRRIRMAFRPVTLQNYRFLTEIWAEKAPKLPIASASWKSLMEQERLDDAYSDFIAALHRKIAEAGGTPRLQAGAAPFLYWPGLVIFVGISFAVSALIVRALQQGETAAMLFLLGFFVLLLWQLGGFFKRNRPRSYGFDELPPDLMPRR